MVLAGLLVVVVAFGYVGLSGLVRNFGGPSCRAVANGTDVTFDPEQTANAATITAVALRRGLPARAATIGTATAIQESDLRNIDYGDRDSLGLFQQRPSQGWGTAAQVMDPVYAAGKFYDALVKIKGYETMEITRVAQLVQRSAFPEAYADHEQEGRILASTLAGHSPGGLGCRLDDASSSTRPTAAVAAVSVAAKVTAELGMTGTVSGDTLVIKASSAQLAWAAGEWSVAHAQEHGTTKVTVGDRTWTRTRDEAGWSWAKAKTPAASASHTVLSFG